MGDRHISIIIPVYNREKEIIDCINSVISQEYPKNCYEIIIVDNNSKDGTVPIIKNIIKANKKTKIKLLYEKKQSSYAARNKGADEAKGKILVFIDSDCIMSEHCLALIEDNLEEIAKMDVKVTDPKNYLHLYQQEYYDSKINNDSFYFETNSIAITKKTFNKIGNFDEKFFSGGDNDYSIRAKKKNVQVKFIEDGMIYHNCRNTLSAYFKMNLFTGRGKVTLLKKYGQNRALAIEIMNPVHYLSILFESVQFLIKAPLEKIIKKKISYRTYKNLYKAISNLGYRLGLIQESARKI